MKLLQKTNSVIGLFAVVMFSVLAGRSEAAELAFESDSSLPIVYLNVAVMGGTAEDPIGKDGIANFMAEMLLRGTSQRSKQQIDLDLDQMGAKLEVETRAEAIILRGAVLTSQLDPFLDLLSEILTQPRFSEGEIRKLKSQMVSSIAEELGSDATLASRRFGSFLFKEHPYGITTKGKSKTVDSFTAQDISSEYDRMIRDSRLLVVGSGDSSQRAKIEMWTEQLGHARAGGEPPRTVAAPTNPDQRELQIVDKPERTQTQIYLGQVGARMDDPDWFALYVGNHIFGGGSFRSRLMNEIRVKRGWSYGAYASFRHGRRPRLWAVHLFPASKDTAAALAKTLDMIEELKVSGVTQEEYDFARNSLIQSAGFMFDTPEKRVENLLLEKTLALPEGLMKRYADGVSKTNRDQVNSALRRFLQTDHLAITVVATAKGLKKPLTKAAGVLESQVSVTPYTQE